MAKFCGKCGTRLDVNTGLCPKCDADRFPGRKEKPQKFKFQKRYLLLPILTVVILLGLIWGLNYFDLIEIPSLSKCHHEWKAATCTEPKVCILCGAVEGTPLGHTPGEWQEYRDTVTCQSTEFVNCINCGTQLDYRVVPMDSLAHNDVFVFTPHQFLERFTELVQQNHEAVSYEITSSEYGMIVYFYYGDSMIALLNFLHPDMSAVMEEELNQYDVYCVSAHFLFQKDATDDSSCVQEFFMACDPKLDENSVYTVTVLSLASLQEAIDAGYFMNTFQYNELLYDVSYFEENRIVPGYDTVLSFSIYPAGTDAVSDAADIQTSPTGNGEPVQENRPVLKSDYQVSTDSDGTSGVNPTNMAFGSEIEKVLVGSIRFLDTLAAAPADAWDVSETQDGTVLAWASLGENGMYDMYIAGEGGVWAPEDCTYLFAEYRFAQTLDFNGAFFVENCRTMQGMFYHDQFLTGLDLSGWDTSSVTNMGSMFFFCSSIQDLDVSSFDTASVTDMSSMFARCEALKSLDLSNFDTSSVTNMNSMFFQSWLLETLNVSSFDTSQVTDMCFMFYSCSLKDLDLSSFDTSSVQVITGFLDGGTSPSTLQVGEKFDLSLLREAAGNNENFMADGGTINGRPWRSLFS